MRSAKAVANYFLGLPGEEQKGGISSLKLQKLVYIAHGWHLALFDEPLVEDEGAEAWLYGPVFPSLYHEFKRFGGDQITSQARELTVWGKKCKWETPKLASAELRSCKLLDKVWQLYGDFTGPQLSDMTHAEDTPWHNTRQSCNGLRNAHIPNKDIANYYKYLMKERRGA